MTVAKGTQIKLASYQEQTYGVLPGTPLGTSLYVTTFEVAKTRALIQPDTITASRQRSRPDPDAVDVTGPINYELAAEDVGALFLNLIGNVVTSGLGPYEHTFTPADLPVGVAFELDNGPIHAGTYQFQTAQGCKIGDVAFNFQTQGFATATFNIIGQDVVYAAAAADPSPMDNGHRSLAMSRATIEEAGVKLGVAGDITLNINNNVETDVRVIQEGGLRYDAPESFVDVSGTLTALFTDSDLLAKAENETPSDLKIILKRGVGDGTIDNEYIELFIGKLLFEETSSVVAGPGTRRIDFNFMGYQDGATDSISAIVRNPFPTVVKT